MLEIIKKLDAGTIRGLVVATIPLLVLIASLFGVDEALFEAKLAEWGEKVALLVSLAGVTWAAYARLFNPTPPLTETAANKTLEMLKSQNPAPPSAGGGKQGGYVRAGMVGLILAFSVAGVTALSLSSCAALGVPSPQGFNEKLATGYSTLSSVRTATASLLSARSITVVEADGVQAKADEARLLLDEASNLKGVDFQNAEVRLVSALRVLAALDSFVVKRRAGQPAEVPR